MKKLLAMLLAFALVLSLAACGPDTPPETTPTTTAPAVTDPAPSKPAVNLPQNPAGDDATLVTTAAGQIRGNVSGSLYIYKGIPYAQATQRFMPAEEVSWDGIFDATAYGPIAIQASGWGAPAHVDGTTATMDNNCQNLNIWAPAEGENLPVMVWLHSGAFSTGASSTDASTEGSNLAANGNVIVVSLNHRLNSLGFFDLSAYGEEYKHSGNVGLLDIVMALEWVQENIAAFGGDPNNVTIFGESGGGAKVMALLTCPAAEGLFHKAVNESGIMDSSGLTFTPKEVAQRVTELTLETLNITAENIADIQTVDYNALTSASDAAMAQAAQEYGLDLLGQTGMQWLPTIGSDVLPDSLVDADGYYEVSNDIPLLVGTNLNELTGFGYMMQYFTMGDKSTWDEETVNNLMTQTYGENAQAVADAFASAYPNKIPADALYVDYMHRYPALKAMLHKVANTDAPVYAYVFTYESGMSLATHTMEVPFVFGNVAATGMFEINEDVSRLENQMHQAWINFAWTGDPSTEDLPWPAFTAEERACMIFDIESYVAYDHDTALLALLDPDYTAEPAQ